MHAVQRRERAVEPWSRLVRLVRRRDVLELAGRDHLHDLRGGNVLGGERSDELCLVQRRPDVVAWEHHVHHVCGRLLLARARLSDLHAVRCRNRERDEWSDELRCVWRGLVLGDAWIDDVHSVRCRVQLAERSDELFRLRRRVVRRWGWFDDVLAVPCGDLRVCARVGCVSDVSSRDDVWARRDRVRRA